MESCLRPSRRPSLCQGRSILPPLRLEICCSSLLGILSTAKAELSVHLSSNRLLYVRIALPPLSQQVERLGRQRGGLCVPWPALLRGTLLSKVDDTSILKKLPTVHH